MRSSDLRLAASTHAQSHIKVATALGQLGRAASEAAKCIEMGIVRGVLGRAARGCLLGLLDCLLVCLTA